MRFKQRNVGIHMVILSPIVTFGDVWKVIAITMKFTYDIVNRCIQLTHNSFENGLLLYRVMA